MGDVGVMGMHVPGSRGGRCARRRCSPRSWGTRASPWGVVGEDALTSLAQLAAGDVAHSDRHSIVPVFARSPATLAMTASHGSHDGGAVFLGLGTRGRLVVEDLHGEKFAKPLTRMASTSTSSARPRVEQPRPRRRVLPHQAVPAPGHPVPGGLADLYRGAEPAEPPAHRRAGRRLAPDLPGPVTHGRGDRRAGSGRERGGPVARGRQDLAAGVDLRHRQPGRRAGPRAPHIGSTSAAWAFLPRVHAPLGFGPDADRVRHAFQRATRDGAAKLVTDDMVDAMTIIGTPTQCRDQLQAIVDAGVHEVRLVFNEPNKDGFLAALRAVAPA